MLLVSAITNNSCSIEDQATNFQSEQNITLSNEQKVLLMDDFSKLLGNSLLPKENRSLLTELIKKRNDDSEAISLKAVLGKEVLRREERLLDTEGTELRNKLNRSLRESIIKELSFNSKEYPQLMEKLSIQTGNVVSYSSSSKYENVIDYLVSNNFDIYFPYSDNFDIATASEFTISWDPMDGAHSNIGYLFDENKINGSSSVNSKINFTTVEEVNDDYAYTNPTLIIRPINDIDEQNSYIISDERINLPPFLYPILPNWQVQGWQGFLTFNADYRRIQDEDILKVTIPKIRVKEQLSTIFAPATISIIKASPNLSLDNNENLIFPLSTHANTLVHKLDIKRKKIRNEEWIDVNILWDDDWNMHEGEQAFIFISHHTFGGDLSANGDVKLGWDSVAKKPKADANINVSFNLNFGNRKELRYNNNISRRSLLTHVVGDTGAGTYTEGNVNYSIRTAGCMDYYFKPHLTKHVTEK